MECELEAIHQNEWIWMNIGWFTPTRNTFSRIHDQIYGSDAMDRNFLAERSSGLSFIDEQEDDEEEMGESSWWTFLYDMTTATAFWS